MVLLRLVLLLPACAFSSTCLINRCHRSYHMFELIVELERQLTVRDKLAPQQVPLHKANRCLQRSHSAYDKGSRQCNRGLMPQLLT